ncbi:hypothetical protein Pmani_000932 [Petrolisthes manimaculis]|uniref:Uncharacterized protein n=1 Tax=Petrolisthes manimaculis TaxID=1843537 RepID=A0AAE1QKZ5_9EUCA|nr:hypothetical protein Pmani_000932 [Petrolisthes manimaculis]
MVTGAKVRSSSQRHPYPAQTLTLDLPAHQVSEAGGTVQAECRMSLGQHSLSAYRTLRVRALQESYVNTPFHSHSHACVGATGVSFFHLVLLTITTIIIL